MKCKNCAYLVKSIHTKSDHVDPKQRSDDPWWICNGTGNRWGNMEKNEADINEEHECEVLNDS